MTVSRRTFLKGVVAGAAGLAGASVVGCDSGSTAPTERPYTATVPGIAADGPPNSQTATPTVTPFTPVSLRERGAALGKIVGTSVDIAENERLPAYRRAAGTNFGLIFLEGSLMQTVIDKFGQQSADSFRSMADTYHQVFVAHPGVWQGDVPKYVTDGTLGVRAYAQQRASLFAGYVRKLDDGFQPTYINFLNEAIFAALGNDGKMYAGWQRTPFFTEFGESIIADVYLIFYQELVGRGFTPGKDFRLCYSDYDIIAPGLKADFAYGALVSNKRRIATGLGVQEADVQLDVAMQCHLDITPTTGLLFHPVPSEADIVSNASRFARIGRLHFTEFDVRGTTDQSVITNTLRMVTRAFRNAPSVLSLCFWESLRQQPRSDGRFFRNGLFDASYQPTDAYTQVATELA